MFKYLPQAWQTRWQQLPARDRQALAIMIVAIVAALVYMLIWQPAHQGLREAKARYVKERELHSYISARRVEVKQVQPAESIEPSQLPALVTRLANAHNIGFERIQTTANNEVELHIAAVGAEPLLKWLQDLPAQGVGVRNAQLTRSAQGQLSATLVLGVME